MPSRRDTLRMALPLLLLLVAGHGCAPAPMDAQGRLAAQSTAGVTLAPLDLVVLHTNDNWGETEPCG